MQRTQHTHMNTPIEARADLNGFGELTRQHLDRDASASVAQRSGESGRRETGCEHNPDNLDCSPF